MPLKQKLWGHKKYSSRGKQAWAKIMQGSRMWALTLALVCLQSY